MKIPSLFETNNCTESIRRWMRYSPVFGAIKGMGIAVAIALTTVIVALPIWEITGLCRLPNETARIMATISSLFVLGIGAICGVVVESSS